MDKSKKLLGMIRKHVESINWDAVRENQRKHLEMVKPTYLENWPAELKRLSLAQDGFELDERTIKAILAFQDPDTFQPEADALRDLAAKIDQSLAIFSGQAFMRLGSRSPKDAFWDEDMRVVSGRQAIGILGASIRVFEDLSLALECGYTPWLFLREWKTIPEWAEFRCFMKDGSLVGISQYYYRKVYPEVAKYAESIKWAIEMFFNSLFKPACHMDTLVFDVVAAVREDSPRVETSVKLLEINPFFTGCDPCLFDWGAPEQQFKGQLRYLESLPNGLKDS